MIYRVQRKELDGYVTLMQCNFEDVYEFCIIAQNNHYRITKCGVDITHKYKNSCKVRVGVYTRRVYPLHGPIVPECVKIVSFDDLDTIKDSSNRCDKCKGFCHYKKEDNV